MLLFSKIFRVADNFKEWQKVTIEKESSFKNEILFGYVDSIPSQRF